MRSVGFYLSQALPPRQRYRLLRHSCAHRYRSSVLNVPPDLRQVRSMLFILPEDTLEALYQVENVVALREHFSQASVSFLCRAEVSDYFRSIAPEASFIDYQLEDRYLHSPVFAAFGISFAHEHFDLCFLLEKHPDMALLDIVGKTGARVRIGYDGACEYPFINYVVRPSTSKSLVQRNCAMARSMGLKTGKRPRLLVAREAIQGVSRLLRDIGVDAAKPFLVIDGGEFVARFGSEWTASLVSALRAGAPATVCATGGSEGGEDSCREIAAAGAKMVPPLTVPRTAALLSKAVCVVAPHTILLRMATLLGKPSVAVLPDGEAGGGAPKELCTAVSYTNSPDAETVSRIVSEARRACPKPLPEPKADAPEPDSTGTDLVS
ncbi:MAG: hypothetical protein GF331_01975 [Chitinivibrionales bacterium]|nr:hypothetical protein [Chitinivibrionales bacterium]